jgi:hypothetical protein
MYALFQLFEMIIYILLDSFLTRIFIALFFSKSEYVIFKLKEMGKIQDKDVMEICNQFRRLDPSNCGHITLPHLLEGRS